MKLKDFLRENQRDLMKHKVLFHWTFPRGQWDLKITERGVAHYKAAKSSSWNRVAIDGIREFEILSVNVLRSILAPIKIHIVTDNP
jgi:hypothetical protein